MFKTEEENLKSVYVVLLMVVAYTFSMAIRMIWVYQFGDAESFHWNDQLMINTNDGYLWATSALHELNGNFEHNPRVMDMYSYGTVFFTYWAAKLLPFSIESIVLYMPAVVSSLVVIPIILIARLYSLTSWGFFAALLGSITWSYYNRTMVGYYDTDMFSAMAPMFILYFLMRTIHKESLHNALFAALAILLYPFLYDAGLSIVYAMGLIYMVYMVIFHTKESFTYQSIILVSVALMGVDWQIKLVVIIALYLLFRQKEFALKPLIIGSIIAILAFLISGNVFALVWAKVAGYAIRGVDESGGLKFYQVAQTVREAGDIPFSTMANRISGSTIGVFVALVGYIALVIKFRPFILALPLIGIGLFSLIGGLRFTVYAVPVAAMSAVFLFYVVASLVSDKRTVKYSIVTLFTALMLYPNITHIIAYKVPTVFNKAEVEVLQKLKSISDPKDYTIAWWDYGYPIWFYSNTNTLIDGGKHNQDNFIVSRILTASSQLEAANLSRIAVETYVDSNYSIVANTLFKNRQEDQVDVNAYLEQLRYGDIDLPQATRDIYLFLPYRMLNILPTVMTFSNIDLESGQLYARAFFYQTSNYKDTEKMLSIGNSIKLDKATGKLHLNSAKGIREVPLKAFYTIQNLKDGTVKVDKQQVDPTSGLSVLFMASYGKFLVLDDRYLNSLYIQMFVLGNYDRNLYEVVANSPYIKIYKQKI